jgi:hypothetical protein
MKNFKITIIEVLAKTIKVKARNYEEALDKVEKIYREEKVVLDSFDHIRTNFDDYIYYC